MPIANKIIRSNKMPVYEKRCLADIDGFTTLPVPPSLNSIYPSNKHNAGRHLSKAGKAYHDTVAAIAVHSGVRLLKGPVKVTMRLYRRQKRGDLGNYEKAVCDGLRGIAWNDDDQIIEIHMYRYDDPKNPRLELKIEPA